MLFSYAPFLSHKCGQQEEDGDEETAAEKRLRIATSYLGKLRKELAADEAAKRSKLDDDYDEEDDGAHASMDRHAAGYILPFVCSRDHCSYLFSDCMRYVLTSGQVHSLPIIANKCERSVDVAIAGMRDVLTRRLQSDAAESRGEAQRYLAVRGIALWCLYIMGTEFTSCRHAAPRGPTSPPNVRLRDFCNQIA